MNDFDVGGRPSATWQRFSTETPGFGRGATPASGILDAFSEMFAQIAASDRPEPARVPVSQENRRPAQLADGDDDDRDAAAAQPDDEPRDPKSAPPRLELPAASRPESVAVVTPERSAAGQNEPATRPAEPRTKPPASAEPDHAADDLDATRGRIPKPEGHDPRIHPAVAEIEPRRREPRHREQSAVPDPRPVSPEGERGRGGERGRVVQRAAGQPVESTEGSPQGHEQGEQGGLFSEKGRHDDRRRDRRERSADEPLASREPSQNPRPSDIKPSAGVEAAMATAGAGDHAGAGAEAADSRATTASHPATPSQPLPMNPASVAAAENSVKANPAKLSSTASSTAADSVKPVEGKPTVDDGRPATSSGQTDSSGQTHSSGQTEARTGTGKRADGREGGSDAVSRAKLVQRVSRAFHQLGGSGGIVRMRLAPAELGSVRIEMRVQDRRVEARVVAESEAAGQILRDHLPELRQRLEAQGMKIERIDVRTEQEPSADTGPDFGRGHHRDPDHDRGHAPHRERGGRPEVDRTPSAATIAPPASLSPAESPLAAAGVDVRW